MVNQIVRRKPGDFVGPKPEILAPAGNRDAFLAALAAGADAVYCGLKAFSARMAAKNFTLSEMAPLAELAHSRKTKLYLTVNTLIKPDELGPLAATLELVTRRIGPDALIVQDLGVVTLARQVGFKGELHLSTLANVTMPQTLPILTKTFDVQRVVLPRELNVEEIKQMAAAAPPSLGWNSSCTAPCATGFRGAATGAAIWAAKAGCAGVACNPAAAVTPRTKRPNAFSPVKT
jgi:putative protease